MDQQIATLKGKNLYNYFGDVKKYMELGPPVSIIITKANFKEFNTEIYGLFDELIDLIS